MTSWKKILLTEDEIEALRHAERLLQECMELADYLARENKNYNDEWYECYKSLRCVQSMIYRYEAMEVWDFNIPLPPIDE